MDKHAISSPDAPKAIGPYSQAIKSGGFVFVSGQLPINPETGELVHDAEGAAGQSMENISAILAEAGSSLDRIVKVTIFLKDMNDFPAVNKVYGSFFTVEPPARSTVQVAKLPKDAVLEIEAIAICG